MKSWHRYAIALAGGLAAGLGAAWKLSNGGLGDGGIRNGPWATSLGYGTKATDPLTRAMVARGGLLALPAGFPCCGASGRGCEPCQRWFVRRV